MKLVQRYIVLTLVMLITLSASGLSISLHTCCGKIEDFSVIGKSKACNMHKASSSTEEQSHNEVKTLGKKCCDDKDITVQKTSEATANKSQTTQKKGFDVLFILNFVRSWFTVSEHSEEEEEDRPSVSWRFSDSLTILFRQFRI